jgi:hypothetical protein
MSRILCSLAWLALTCAAATAEPDPEPDGFSAGWDRPVDPDNDCKFKREKGGLTITLPGKSHDLDAGRMNAPRLLRDVEGDFVALVRIDGKFAPSANAPRARELPYVSAGLVVMASDRPFACLQRSVRRSGNRESSQANWMLYEAGIPGKGFGASFTLKGKPAYLRLERKGNRLLASFGDGKKWAELRPFVVKLPKKVKVGVTASTNSTEPFSPHFDRFKLRQGKGQ